MSKPMIDKRVLFGQVRGILAFAAAISVMAFLWLVLLPAIARHPAIAEERDRQRRQGVDPSAMYYTELDMIDDTMQWLRDLSSSSKLAEGETRLVNPHDGTGTP